ncbi:TonB-dependent receptor [Marinoscillum sp.]|uniref:TonB-dependent receptor n=1 Tax=Marinoscillum sp. TaxID=2024838 RepID=UPI003BAB4D7D
MKSLILLWVACVASLALSAQKVLNGSVVDADTHEPLIGVNLYLLSDFSKGTTTDFDGEFQLKLASDHLSDTLLISYVGYYERMIPVQALPLQIELTSRDLEMNAVEVIAEPLVAEEFKFVKVSKLGIYTNPASKADPLLSVNTLPAATTTDESASISLRGSSPVETGIFLNNVPVYDAVRYSQLNGIGTFSLFNTALIKDVTVFPGNPPLEFTSSTAGVVSITTDDNQLQTSNNSVIISPANIGFQRNQQMGKQNLKVFTNYQPSTVLKWMNPGALNQLNSFQSVDGGLYLYGQLSEKVSYKTYNYGLLEQYDYQYLHPTFNGSLLQKRTKAFNVSNVYLDTSFGLLSWNQGYAFSSGNFDYSRASFVVSRKSLYQGLSLFNGGEKWQLKSGFNWDMNHSAIDGRLFQHAYAIGDEYPTVSVDDTLQTSNVEGFVYGKYYLTDEWILGGGLRKNLNQLDQHNFLSGQLNITYQLTPEWKFIAGVGRYHKLGLDTDQGQKVFVRSDQASLDVFYDGEIDASASIFTKAVSNNGLETDVSGIEVFLDKSFGKNWSVDLTYTYLKASQFSSYDIRYFFKSNLQYTPGLWTLALNGVYREGLPFGELETVSFDQDLGVYVPQFTRETARYRDYFILNLAVSRLLPISEELTMVAFASINNLTDHENIRSYRFDFEYDTRSADLLSRRMVYAGLQINF